MTIERLFSNLEAQFSGYEDISLVPDADRYIWIYLAPMNPDIAKNASSISSYINMLNLTLHMIDKNKMVVIFTMKSFYETNSVISQKSIADAIISYNKSVNEISNNYPNVKIVDIESFAENYSYKELIDWKYYFISQMAMNPRLAKPFQQWFSHQLDAIEMKRKKCLVLDMDNTLWGGVLGEDGVEGIKLGGDYPGKVFLYFQKQLKELSHQGVMLAVCSKNNMSDVLELWEKHPDCILKEGDFTICKINWQNKADNIRQMATDLNIGLDSMVFIDDNPTERALVRQEIPEVEVPDFPKQPYELPEFLKNVAEKYFLIYSLTKEDLSKTEQYKANALRNSSKTMFADMNEYIKSLDIHLSIKEVNEITISRVAQMTQKTNQFNLTTKRYTESDINGFIAMGYRIYTLSVSDKFGDNGITGMAIIVFDGPKATIDSFLLSCRILGKDIEMAFVSYILNALKNENIKELYAEYIPTAKNSQVKEFWDRCGLKLISETKNGEKFYKMNVIRKSISKNYTII